MLYLKLGFINDLRGTVGALICWLHFVCRDVMVETAGGVQHLAALSTLQCLPSGHFYNLFNASLLCDSCVCEWTTDNKIGVGPVNLCVAGLVSTTHGHCSHHALPAHSLATEDQTIVETNEGNE